MLRLDKSAILRYYKRSNKSVGVGKLFMELSPKQQISELIKQNQRILIVSHRGAGGDAIGSMLALERVLTKAGKEVTLVYSDELDANLSFLPGIEKIQHDIVGARDLIIRIDREKFPIEKLNYNEEDGHLNIILTPVRTLDKNNLEFVQGTFKFDLIFVLDTADVEKIDAVYDRYTELFFETPIVNVDHHSGNEYFGTVNMVDLTATSTAEILVSIIESLGAGNFDADVATCLLTGIIADTASFKNTNTTPKSLTISAQMLAAGARQQEVIQNLYKTRPLSTLKLWGRVLSNMDYDHAHRLVISTISRADFVASGSNIDEIYGVTDELLTNAPGTDVVLMLAESEKNSLVGQLKGLNGVDVLAMAEAFGGSGHVLSAGFEIMNASLATHKESILTKIVSLRDKQLGRSGGESQEPINVVEIIKDTRPRIEEVAEEPSFNPELSTDVSYYNKEVFELIAKEVGQEVLASEPIETTKEEDVIAKAILSIDNEVEGVSEVTPNIDVEAAKNKNEALQQIGEVIRGYNPGRPVEEKGDQPVDATIWK